VLGVGCWQRKANESQTSRLRHDGECGILFGDLGSQSTVGVCRCIHTNSRTQTSWNTTYKLPVESLELTASKKIPSQIDFIMSKKSFGLDEMAALAGGAVEEMAAFRPSAPATFNTQKSTAKNAQPDLSTMSAAETAAMLQRKSSAKNQAQGIGRYRTTRQLAHHALAQEISEEFQGKHQRQNQILERVIDEQDEEEFVAQSSTTVRRQKVAPEIVSSSRFNNEVSQRGRTRRAPVRDSSSSSDSSDESHSRRRRGRNRKQTNGVDDDSNSSSSSDEEADRRRERLRAAGRKREEPRLVTLRPAATFEDIDPIKESIPSKSEEPRLPTIRDDPQQASPSKRIAKPETSTSESSSSSDDSNSDDSSDSSSSSSSSDEEDGFMAKPLFVPKHKRNLVQDEEKKWEEEERRMEMEKKMTEKRKQESRTMVAKTVAAVQEKSLAEEDMEDEGIGATNGPPNDDDDIDIEQARDAWEIRELRRLLDAVDEMKQQEKQQLERERRRQMTDEEVLEYDKKVGRYQAPGSNRQPGTSQPGSFLQRYYHRGAFYMDKEEFDEKDVRHRAAEYARAATGGDKIDKSALPKVMQVKGFGLARQNTKYQGLAKEDTTDKRQDLLPIVHKNR